MQRYKQVLIGVSLVLAVGMVSMPARAAALTTNQVNAILMLLQSFGADQSVISSVQATLTGAVGTSTPAQPTPSIGQGGMSPGQVGKMICIALTRNLALGAKGDDVRKLQDVLREDPDSGFTASSTGTFGPMTAKAMARFQMKNGIASSTTGAVGPITRAFFERACGKGLDGERGKPEQQGKQERNEGTMSQKGEQRMFFGTIQTVTSSALTLQLKGGTTTPTIAITSSTIIKVAVASSTPRTGTTADLTVGAQAGVEVAKGPNGSLTALMIGVGMPMPQMQTMPMMQGQERGSRNDR